MPSLIAPQLTEPPQRKFFNNITSTKNSFRQYNNNSFPSSGRGSMSKNGPSHSLSLSDNTKFLLCCFCWYLSSSLSSNTGKQIMNHFRYPVTLTYVQFIFVACWSAIAEKAVNMKNIRKPTKVIIQTIIPLSIFMIVGHVFSSISISRIPVSLVHTIKALAPLFTVLFYRFIFKVHYSSKVYTALIPLTTGVILACSFTFSNNLIGLLCALASCLIFVLQNIFSKKLLFKESKKGSSNPNKLDKMNMMFYSAFIAFVLMTPMWFYYDGFHILFNQANRDISRTKLLYYFLLNGTTHFAQNWFAFTTLSMSSPVTYSIASLVKRIFVIVMSIIWFGQQVSLIQSLGIILTFVGLWMYQSAKREVDQGESKACERSIDVLPTSNKGQDAEEILLNEKSHLPNSNALNNPAMTMKKWIGNHIPGSNTARNVKLL